MAKRSDFAQKLLDDLRLRKERMAVSQSTKGSKPVAADAYTCSKQTYRGTKEMKTRQTNGVRSGSTHNRFSAGNRSLSIEECSNQIVPFRRGQSSEQIGDLSMALAFALENGGKLRGVDSSNNSSIIGFLHQYGRRSVEVSKMERNRVDRHHPSTSSFPTLSHLHIKEISRGAQKLNQILKACSSGLNFDSYSIEIGKELLKGAMDLQESLRMLVNLQEASEYMIRPQSKTRITLLDDDEDDDDNTVKTLENNQLAWPRFSFDKPSRNSHYIQEVAKTDLRQRLMALTYASESTNNNAFSEQKSHSSSSKSKPEKGRIPNVIAKLMGLEELPANEDTKSTKKESSSGQRTQGIITKKSLEGSSTQERRTKDALNAVPTLRKQKQKEAYHIQARDNTYALQSEKNPATHHANFEVISHDGKSPPKRVEGIKPTTSSNKANMKIDKSQISTSQLNQSRGSRKDIQQKERKQDPTKIREQKGKERGETKDMTPNHELQQMEAQARNGSEDATILHRQVECHASMLKTEKGDTNGHLSNNQPKSPNDLGFQQLHKLHNFGPQDINHRAAESEQQGAKQNIQARRKKESEEMNRCLTKHMHDTLNLQRRHPHINQATPSNRSSSDSTDATQSKLFPINRHQEDLVQGRISSTQDSVSRNLNQNFSARDLKLNRKEKTSIPQAMEEKHVHLPTTRKAKNTKVHKVETPQKINELMTRRTATQHNLARPQKNQTSISQDVNQQRRDKLGGSKEAEQARAIRSKDAEVCIVKSNRSVASNQQSNLVGELQIKSEQASDLYSAPVDDECKKPKIQAPNESHESIISILSNDQQGQILHLGRDEFKSHKIVMDPLNETYHGSRDTANPSQLKDPKATKLETPEPLTESEYQLKHVLIKSQLFLNTAEALFKLNIPFGILHAGGHDCPNEESKLILDCGYELMKRKGKREELIINPLMTISITSSKVRTLDDLIKQLHKYLKKLKSYGRHDDDYDDNVIEDYLPKMLESDVYNLDPDMNCMWDFGWNTMMFAIFEKDDVVKDVERFLLNLLLDEVTRDLLPVL